MSVPRATFLPLTIPYPATREMAMREEGIAMDIGMNIEQYRLLFEKNPVAMCVFDQETFAFLEVNEAAVRQYGYTREEFLSLGILDIRPSEDVSRVRSILSEPKNRPATDRFDQGGVWRHQKKDGTIIDVEIRKCGIVFQGRKAILILANDVSERKRTEEALYERDSRLRILLEQMPAVLWTTDCNLVITTSVGAGLASLNLRPNQLVGVTMGEYLGTNDPEFPPMAAHLQALQGSSVSYESEWQSHWYRTHIEPLRDGEGTIVGSIGVCFDLTERKQAEEALRSTQEYLRHLLASSPTFLYSLKIQDGVVLPAWVSDNITRIMGYTAEETMAPYWWEKNLYPEDRPRALAFKNMLLKIDSFEHEYRFRHKNGEYRWIRDELRLLRDGTGKPTEIIGAWYDIQERKHAEEERHRLFEIVRDGRERLQFLSQRLLEVQETERRHLARELHDEIGQSLTGLKLTLETSMRRPGEDLRASLQRALALVQDLTSQVRDLSMRLRPTMLDDLGLPAALLWHFERYTASTGVRVAFVHNGVEERVAPEVETAAYRIVQEALTNVARHAGVREAKVRLWRQDDLLQVQVEDMGVGFDPDAALASRNSSGLSGARERAELLGGRLDIDSEPGRGTRLTAELPLRIEQEEQEHVADHTACG